MKRYAIYAGDQLFGGLHGMCTRTVIEANSLKEAQEYAFQESLEVIQSYSDIYEHLEENAEYYAESGNDDDFAETLEELQNEDTEYTVWEIDETKAAKLTTSMLDSMFYNDPDGFPDEYCLPLS